VIDAGVRETVKAHKTGLENVCTFKRNDCAPPKSLGKEKLQRVPVAGTTSRKNRWSKKKKQGKRIASRLL